MNVRNMVRSYYIFREVIYDSCVCSYALATANSIYKFMNGSVRRFCFGRLMNELFVAINTHALVARPHFGVQHTSAATVTQE